MESEDKGILKELQEFQNNSEYFNEHLDEYKEKYPGEFVAIYEEKLVAHGKMIEVFEKLDEMGIKKALVKYVKKKDEIWIFPAYA